MKIANYRTTLFKHKHISSVSSKNNKRSLNKALRKHFSKITFKDFGN